MPRIIQVVLLVFEMIALSFLFSRISGIKLTWIKYVLIPFIYIFFNLLLFVLFSETFLTYLDLPVYFLTFSLLLTRQSSIPIMLSFPSCSLESSISYINFFCYSYFRFGI